MLKQLFCNHDYEIEKTIQSPSEMETFKKSGGDPRTLNDIIVLQMCHKKLTIIQKCNRCQKSKITTVTT